MRSIVVAAAAVTCSVGVARADPPGGAGEPYLTTVLPMPTPSGFALYPTDDYGNPRGPFRCGEHDITVDEAAADGGTERLAVTRGGRVVWERTVQVPGLFGPHLSPIWCFDVTGDGHPELLVAERTGGSHCCNVETLVSLATPPRVLVRYDDDGWGGNLTPLETGRGTPYPLYAQIDSEGPVYEPLCGAHADRPFLPIVYALRDGRYVRATRRHPEILRAVRARAQAGIARAMAEGELSPYFCQEPFEVLTASLALGDWPRVRRTLPANLRRMLDQGRSLVARLTADGARRTSAASPTGHATAATRPQRRPPNAHGTRARGPGTGLAR